MTFCHSIARTDCSHTSHLIASTNLRVYLLLKESVHPYYLPPAHIWTEGIQVSGAAVQTSAYWSWPESTACVLSATAEAHAVGKHVDHMPLWEATTTHSLAHPPMHMAVAKVVHPSKQPHELTS